MNRGSTTQRPPPRSNHASFNEAPIHESGKFAYGSKLRDQPRSFNEAPIHESGKSDWR